MVFQGFYYVIFASDISVHSTSKTSLYPPFHFQKTSVRYLPCFAPIVPQACSDRGMKFNMGRPIWSAPIQDQQWVTATLADIKSMKDRYPAYDGISTFRT